MKPLALLLVVLGALTLSACGESKQDKAKKQVCSARSDIQKQVDTLKGLTLGASTLTDVKDGVSAIEKDLKTIKDAQPNLDSKRKQQVQDATDAFTKQLGTIVQDALGNLSLSNASAQLKTATTQLEDAFKQALAPVDCS